MPPKAKGEAKAKAKGEAKPKKEKKDEEEEANKVKPPDRDEFQGKLNAIQEEIDKLQTKKKEINDQISAQSGGRDDFFQERNRIKSQLDEINEQLAKFEGKKEAINDNIGKQKQEKTDALNQINKMKRTIGYDSEASIDDRIATIEFKLWTESITLKEEKKIFAGDCRAQAKPTKGEPSGIIGRGTEITL